MIISTAITESTRKIDVFFDMRKSLILETNTQDIFELVESYNIELNVEELLYPQQLHFSLIMRFGF